MLKITGSASSYKKLLKKLGDASIGVSSELKKKLNKFLTEGSLHKLIKEDWDCAKNERGEDIQVTPILEEYLRLLLDYRVNQVVCGGCAQIGKSLFAIVAYSYTTCKLGFNCLFLFPQQQSLERLVPLNHRSVVENWEKTLYKGKKRNLITNLKTIKSLSGGVILYSYSTTKTQDNEGAAAKSSIVSFSVDALYIDEVSQYPKGAVEMAFRRLDAGRIPTQPVRLLGTAGNGGGIERYITNCDYQFYPSVVCNNCGEVTFLDPFGGLLADSNVFDVKGDSYKSYLSATGRPIHWYGKDKQITTDTQKASIVCQHCHSQISDEQIEASNFRDKVSKVRLVDFLDNLPDKEFYSVSVELSPLLRGNKKVSKLLKEGLTTSAPSDWVQQALGKPSEFGNTSITLEQIYCGFNKTLPKAKQSKYDYGCSSIVIAGIDQGHSADHVVIIRYYYNYDRDINFIAENSYREFLYFGAVSRAEIPTILSNYKVQFGFIDNEPSIDSAAEVVRKTNCLMLVDQQGKQKDDFILGDAKDGGYNFPCVKINHRKFGRSLIVGFSRVSKEGIPLYQFSPATDWILTATRDVSPARHLTSVVYDPEDGLLKRPVDKVDHYFFATLFAEAAFSYSLEFSTGGASKRLSMSAWL